MTEILAYCFLLCYNHGGISIAAELNIEGKTGVIKVILVEDDAKDAGIFKACLKRYGEENSETFSLKVYDSALTFLSEYKSDAEMVFMDIELPDIDGMEASRRLREIDNKVVLVFVTNMAQYASKGYEVNAVDFILKPLQYYDFNMKMKKAVRVVQQYSEKYFMLSEGGVKRRICVNDVIYVEVMVHNVVYHTEKGNIEIKGSLKETEKLLESYGFARCNNCYLVSLRHVTEIGKNTVIAGGEELQMSRPKRKAFIKSLADFYGGGCN